MKSAASWRSKLSRWIVSAAYTGETQRVTTTEQLAGVLARQSLTASGAPVNADTAMRVGAVYACVRVLTDSVAMLPLRLYREAADGTATLENTHPLDKLMRRRPHPAYTAFEFKRLLVGCILLRGNFYAIKSFGVANTITALTPLHPDRIEPQWNKAGTAIEYVVRMQGKEPRTYPARDILHIRGFATDGLKGMSVIAAAAQAIGLSLTAEKHGAKMLSGGASPSGVLRHPAQLSPEAAGRLKDSFEAKYSGSENAGSTMLLEEGLTWEKVGMTSEESQFIDQRKFQRSEIAMFFGVPPHMIGDVERGTSWGSGIEHQGIGFVTYTLLPHLTNIVQACERDLIAESDQDSLEFQFQTDTLTRADFLTRQSGRKIQLDSGVINPNEWRRLEGMNPREGGDEYKKVNAPAPRPFGARPGAEPDDDEPDDDETDDTNARNPIDLLRRRHG